MTWLEETRTQAIRERQHGINADNHHVRVWVTDLIARALLEGRNELKVTVSHTSLVHILYEWGGSRCDGVHVGHAQLELILQGYREKRITVTLVKLPWWRGGGSYWHLTWRNPS